MATIKSCLRWSLPGNLEHHWRWFPSTKTRDRHQGAKHSAWTCKGGIGPCARSWLGADNCWIIIKASQLLIRHLRHIGEGGSHEKILGKAAAYWEPFPKIDRPDGPCKATQKRLKVIVEVVTILFHHDDHMKLFITSSYNVLASSSISPTVLGQTWCSSQQYPSFLQKNFT